MTMHMPSVTDTAETEEVATGEHQEDGQATGQKMAEPVAQKNLIDQAAIPPAPPATPTSPVKAVSYNEILGAVQEKIWAWYERMNEGLPYEEQTRVGMIRVYDGYGVVEVNRQYWRFAYTFEGNMATLAPRTEWQLVEMDWVIKNHMDETLVVMGDAVKAVGEIGDGWIGGWLVRHTHENAPDLVKDFFDYATDYGPHDTTLVYYDHSLDPTLGHKSIGLKREGKNLASLKHTEVGVWIQQQLDLSDEYEAALYQLAQAGKLSWSSGTAKHLIRKHLVGGKAYHIDYWPLGIDASLTVRPAAGPGITQVVPLKSLATAERPTIKSLMGGLPKTPPTPTLLEELDMTKDELKTLLGEAIGPIANQVAEQGKLLDGLKAAPPTNSLPRAVGSSETAEPATEPSAAVKSVYQIRFGDESAAMKAVMSDIAGKGYEQTLYDQLKAFNRFAKFGKDELDANERKLLRLQIYAPSQIKQLVMDGVEVTAIKDMMVATQGQLGGFAIPPMVQEEIVTRLPGASTVRANGARVINTNNGLGVHITVYDGGDSRYRGNLRGRWGGEKSKAQETNAKFKQVQVVPNPYQFYVPMSRTLLNSASNVVALLTEDIVTTAAIDENEAFLVGDGTNGKPLGVLPGGVYDSSLGIGSVDSEDTVTADALIELSDDLDDQYTEGAVFVFRKTTGTVIRKLKDANDDYLFQRGIAQGQPNTLLGNRYFRDEAMPAIAVGAAPVLFGNMRGYTIVQEPGMAIERMQDTTTGLGEVQFHVYRMLGGRVEKHWMFSCLNIVNNS